MKYELYFLNNIHDSIEAVNVELDSYFDCIHDYKYYDPMSIKHIIINLANCCELLVKFRLEEEHWTLIFADIDKASCEAHKNGNFVSVSLRDGINRLQKICEVKSDFTACKRIYQYRNSLMHYTLNDTYIDILSDISDAMREVVSFVENEIMELLPSEAKNDYIDSIKEYMDKAVKIETTIAKILAE